MYSTAPADRAILVLHINIETILKCANKRILTCLKCYQPNIRSQIIYLMYVQTGFGINKDWYAIKLNQSNQIQLYIYIYIYIVIKTQTYKCTIYVLNVNFVTV